VAMSDFSDYELEREANIARNREILAKLDFSVDLPPAGKKEDAKPKAKPVQPAKKAKREKETAEPVRQSARLRRAAVDHNESPSKKRKREKEEEEQRAKEAEERLEAEERAREAKRPRHQDLELTSMADELELEELTALRATFQTTLQTVHPKRMAKQDAFVFENDKLEDSAVQVLRETLSRLKVVARAKVTQDRIYSAAYHAEPTKDLIFFGGMGQPLASSSTHATHVICD